MLHELVDRKIRDERKNAEWAVAAASDEIAKLSNGIVPGSVSFKLYDTYGFPLDLTRVIAEENSLAVDEPGFEKCMDRQRAESRSRSRLSTPRPGRPV